MKDLDLLVKNIKNNQLLPIYFFHGKEPYYIDLLVNELKNNVLTEEEKAFNLTVIYGKETTYADIFSMAYQYPMGGDRQIIIVKEAQEIPYKNKENDEKAIIKYAKNPAPFTILVFAHKKSELDGKKKALNEAMKPYLFLSEPIKDWELPKKIKTEIDRLKIKTTPNIPNLLAEYLGNDLSKIYNELNKIKILIKDNEIFDEKLAEKYIGISKEYNNFELQKAITTKDLNKAYKIIYFMGKNKKNEKNSVDMLFSLLFNYFAQLITYHILTNKTPTNVMKELNIKHANFVKDYETSARLFPLKQCTKVISILRNIDMKFKGVGSRTTSDSYKELLIELVYKIINCNEIQVK